MTLRTEDKFCDFVVFFLVGQYGNEQGHSYFSDRDYFLAHGCITAIRSWTNRPSGNYLAGYVVNHPVRYLQYYSLTTGLPGIGRSGLQRPFSHSQKKDIFFHFVWDNR